MLTAYWCEAGRLVGGPATAAGEVGSSDAVIWWDLFAPTEAEIAVVEAAAGVGLPTEAQMQEIEVSRRLYDADGAIFMTAVLLSEADTARPVSRAATFVLTERHLITIRHSKPRPFTTFAERVAHDAGRHTTPEMLLCGLWQAIIARSADVVERLAGEIDQLSEQVFRRRAAGEAVKSETFRDILKRLGEAQDLASRIRESLFSLARAMGFPEQCEAALSTEFRTVAHRLRRDVGALSDHTEFLSGKILFLLDVTLGMINVEQNAIIRSLSLVATVFLPPTLIASLYGMNFEHMPELSWPYAYPIALGAIALSGLAPYLVFKFRGWL